MVARLLVAMLVLCTSRTLGQPTMSSCSICVCSPATRRVDCTPNPAFSGIDFQFSFIPQDLPEDTVTLIMTGNILTSLEPDSFSSYPFLATLDLSQNLFTGVPSEGLLNLSISSLILDGNPITQIQTASFETLSSLQSLSLRRMPTLDNVETLQGLGNLQTLLLDDNLLDSIPEDFLTATPQLTMLSLRNNTLQSLPERFLQPVTLSRIDLSLNPWSCDCNLQWLRMYLDANPALTLTDPAETVCHWPPQHNDPRMRIDSITAADYLCYEPTITEHPVDMAILSNLTLVIPCGVNAAPFPDVVWIKDGEVVNFTSRVSIQRYDAALRFQNQSVEDSGAYQCIVSNSEGSNSSELANIQVLESTCFDTVFTMAHETDRDCGGPFCIPCNVTQGCELDRDCVGDLVCLYSHTLLNSLHYISPNNSDAHTCANPEVPPTLLQNILSAQLPLGQDTTLSGNVSLPSLQSSIHDYLATLLEIPRSVISNVRVTSVEKIERPLIQVSFDLPSSAQGQAGKSNILSQIDSGNLKATVRIKDEDGAIQCRLNL